MKIQVNFSCLCLSSTQLALFFWERNFYRFFSHMLNCQVGRVYQAGWFFILFSVWELGLLILSIYSNLNLHCYCYCWCLSLKINQYTHSWVWLLFISVRCFIFWLIPVELLFIFWAAQNPIGSFGSFLQSNPDPIILCEPGQTTQKNYQLRDY